MQSLIDRAMRDGAVGFSTGLEYVPGMYSNTAEVVALAKAAAAHGGVYTSHMRDEGIHEIEAITEAVNVGKEAGMPVEISHLKIDRRRIWGASDQSLALIEKFRREGVDVVADQYPYDRASTNLGIRLPGWALAGGKIKERLADPATRRKIAAGDEAEPGRNGRAGLRLRHRGALRPEPRLRRQDHLRDQRAEGPRARRRQRNRDHLRPDERRRRVA